MRFLTQADMASIRYETSVRFSLKKRGEMPRNAHTAICVCGCGVVGCHFEYDASKGLQPKEAPPPPQSKKKF